MKITIHPENDGEAAMLADWAATEYAGVSEFALVGTRLEQGLVPQPIVRSHGDPVGLYGKLEALKLMLMVYATAGEQEVGLGSYWDGC